VTNSGYCLFYIGEEEGVTMELLVRSEEGFNLRWLGNATIIQELSY
jgi:hypothetical protein